MSNQRIEIIIQEINYWKEHKLLPDVYCDFLLALYTKGENQENATARKNIGLAFFIQFLLLLFSVIVMNISDIQPVFQVILLPLSLIIMFWLFKKLHKNRDIFFILSTIMLLVHFLLISTFLGNQLSSNQWLINIIVIFNFICWFVVGRKYQFKFLQIMSVILTIFTMIYMFFKSLLS